jgi:hypothetical protein
MTCTGARAALAGFLVAAGTLAAARDARAQAGTAFCETSRVAALANAVSARPGDAGSVLMNPAGLADMDEGQLLFTGSADRLDSWFARPGEPKQDRSRWFGGLGFAAATPLPGPAWVRRIHVGFALDLPAQYVLRVHVPVRDDEPTSPIYDGRPDRMAALAAFAVEILPRLKVGAGFTLTPGLELPTQVTYVAGRDPDVNKSVEVRIDSKLDLAASGFVGVRAQPLDALALSLVYRGAQASRATGTQTTIAGGILATDPIDFYDLWDPAELTFGAAVALAPGWSVSTDVTWHRWSEFCTGHDRCPSQPAGAPLPPLPAALQFHDTVSVGGGVEYSSRRGFALRGGLAAEPSPIPAQSGLTNYLGANTLVVALGGGLDLRKLAKLPLMVDAHVRARFDALQSAVKDPATLPDADPNLPGAQIDNYGYPGFTSQSFAVQAGATLTVFLGSHR